MHLHRPFILIAVLVCLSKRLGVVGPLRGAACIKPCTDLDAFPQLYRSRPALASRLSPHCTTATTISCCLLFHRQASMYERWNSLLT